MQQLDPVQCYNDIADMTYEAFNKERESKAGQITNSGVNEEEMALKLPGVDSVNSSMLRNDENFDVDPAIFSLGGIVSKKTRILAGHVMLMWQSMPVFSGNISEYLVNQLIEVDLVNNSKNKVLPANAQVPNLAPTSTVFPYM